MANPLLLRTAADLLARKQQVIESIDKLSIYGRLAEIVAADLAALDSPANAADVSATPVEVRLEFGWADAQQRWPRVQGTAAVTLPAVCQRCLGLCDIELRVPIDLLLIKSRDTRGADDALEIWELDSELLRPLDIVEEMLVMALPLAPKHRDTRDCGAIEVVSPLPERNTQDRIRPFANLKKDLEQPR